MTAFVTTGDHNGVSVLGKKSRVKAHRNRKIEKRECKRQAADARGRSDQFSLHCALADFAVDPTDYRSSSNRCPCTGLTPALNGFVREGNIVLHYSNGKLLSAHCG